MQVELRIIHRFVSDKAAFQKYFDHIEVEKIDSPELILLFKEINLFYQKHEDASVELFIGFVKSKVIVNDLLKLFLHQLEDYEEDNPAAIEDILENYRSRALAKGISLLSFEVYEGRKTTDELLGYIDNALRTKDVVVEQFVSSDLEQLYENTARKQGLRWRLQTMNRMLGSLRKGDFGFLFARPESGKTTFLASEVTHFAEQAERPILWCNNEEEGQKVQLRIYQGCLGLSKQDLFKDIKRNHEEYLRRTRDNIKLYDSARISRRDVERLCEQLQPACIVLDQIDKIQGFTGDREDLRLGNIYIWAREIAKEFAPVIGVTQASGEGEGVRWLTMDHVSSAKTAKQAEADWILGIGKSRDDGLEYVRHLHLSKNKLDGDLDTDPALRHGKADVLINPIIGRYNDI